VSNFDIVCFHVVWHAITNNC